MARRNKDIRAKKRNDTTAQTPEARLEHVRRLDAEGYRNRAEKQCQQLIADHPDYVGALFEMARILYQDQKLHSASEYLNRARLYAPSEIRLIEALADIYVTLESNEMALSLLEEAINIHPNSAELHYLKSEALAGLGRMEEAVGSYRRTLMLDREHAHAPRNLAQALLKLDRKSEATEILTTALRSSKLLHLRLDCLALLAANGSLFPTVKLSQEYERMKAILADVPPPPDFPIDWIRLALAIRLDDPAEVWKLAKRTNEDNKPPNISDETEALSVQTEMLRATEPLPKPHAFKPTGSDPNNSLVKSRTLHILGCSRSGKTTLESLLKGHPNVVPGYETAFLPRSIRETLHQADMSVQSPLQKLPEALLPLMAANYEQKNARLCSSPAVVTCTIPSDIAHVVTLARACPEARFLFVKRDRFDTALRMYFTHYKTANYYSYDLAQALAHIDAYNDLVLQLERVLPGRTMTVWYEDLVEDPQPVVNRIFDFVGLENSMTQVPPIGDDRGCSKPYRVFMDAELEAK